MSKKLLLASLIFVGMAMTIYQFVTEDTKNPAMVTNTDQTPISPPKVLNEASKTEQVRDNVTPALQTDEKRNSSAEKPEGNGKDSNDVNEFLGIERDFEEARQRFAALFIEEKLDERVVALEKLITEKKLDFRNKVALEPLEPAHRELLEREKQLANNQVEIDSLTIGVERRPKIIENKVLVYVAESNHQLLDRISNMDEV